MTRPSLPFRRSAAPPSRPSCPRLPSPPLASPGGAPCLPPPGRPLRGVKRVHLADGVAVRRAWRLRACAGARLAYSAACVVHTSLVNKSVLSSSSEGLGGARIYRLYSLTSDLQEARAYRESKHASKICGRFGIGEAGAGYVQGLVRRGREETGTQCGSERKRATKWFGERSCASVPWPSLRGQ